MLIPPTVRRHAEHGRMSVARTVARGRCARAAATLHHVVQREPASVPTGYGPWRTIQWRPVPNWVACGRYGGHFKVFRGTSEAAG